MWDDFLSHPMAYCRPFLDFSADTNVETLDFYTDSSGVIGMGGVCGKQWMAEVWSNDFLNKCKPSIAYLELYALVAGVLAWVHQFRNRQIVLHCDNQSVVNMVNHTSSSCKQCMVLVRILVLHSLKMNVRIYARYVTSKSNTQVDMLSRGMIHVFMCKNPGYINVSKTPVPAVMWPPEKLWLN